MAPAVSLVIPAFQAERTLGAALSGALRQTWSPLEVIVVDDGSTDRTGEIAAAHGPGVRVVRQPNRGVAAARNRGVAEATGELVAFCDADDVLFDEHIEALVATQAAAGTRRALATANAWWLFPGGIHPGQTRHKGRFPRPAEQRRAILEQNFVSTMSLFPRSLAAEIGPFDEALSHAEDWDFWLRAVLAGHRVVHQARPLALYRWHAAGLTADRDRMDEGARAVLAKAATRADLTPAERGYVERRLAGPGPHELARRGDACLRAGRYRDAATAYRQAAALCPSEQALVRKARLLGLAPPVLGPLLRARQRAREDAVGFDEGHVR